MTGYIIRKKEALLLFSFFRTLQFHLIRDHADAPGLLWTLHSLLQEPKRHSSHLIIVTVHAAERKSEDVQRFDAVIAHQGDVMANADPLLLAAAKYVTDTNDNDGVAKAVERFCLT